MAGPNAGEVKAKLTLENSDFKRKMDESKARMEDARGSVDRLKGSFDAVQKGATIMGGAVLTGIGASVKIAADFEQSIARVGAISGATGDDLKRLEDMAREMGATTTFSASEAAGALEFLSMAGYTVDDSISSLPGVLNLAAAAQVDLATSADIVSNIMQGFGMEASETGTAVDILSKTMNTANTDLPQLGGAMKMVAPVANALGISMEDTSTAIAMMSNAGIQGSQAGTTLRAALISLANPTGQTAKAMEELGIEVTDSEGAMKPLPELIGHVAGKLDGMTEAQKTQTAAQLVGREAASGFLALLEVGEDGLADYSQALTDSAGTAQTMADVQNDTVNGAFKAFQSALEEVGIAVGNEYLPAVRNIIDTGTDIMRWLGDLNPELITMALNFAGATAAIAVTITTLGKLAIAVKGLFAAMGPTGWLILGVSLLGGAIIAHNIEAEKMAEVNLDVANSLNDTHTELSEAATRYDELRREAKLTTDEIGELLDLREDMAGMPEGEALDKLKSKYDDLQEKSGLSAEKLEELLERNDDIIEKAPQTAEAHSKQGNAIAGVNEKLEEYLSNLSQMAEDELDLERMKWAEQREEHVQNLNTAKREMENIDTRINLLGDYQNLSQDELNRLLDETRHKQADYLLTEEEKVALSNEEKILKELIDNGVAKTIESLQKQKSEQNEIVSAAELELAKGEELDVLYSNIHLKKLGINETGQEGLDIAEKNLGKLKDEYKQVQDRIAQEGDKTGLLDEQLGVLGNQIGEHESIIGLLDRETGFTATLLDDERKKEARIQATNDTLAESAGIHNNNTAAQEGTNAKIDEGTGKAREMNDSLSRDTLKRIKITDNGAVDDLNRRAAEPVTKMINFREVRPISTKHNGPYATRHQGGPARPTAMDFASRAPQKLHVGGTPQFNEVDVRLLRNEMVLTEGQQARLFSALQRSESVGTGGAAISMAETNALLNAMRGELSNLRDLRVFLDTGVLVGELEPGISTQQAQDYDFRRTFNGDRGQF